MGEVVRILHPHEIRLNEHHNLLSAHDTILAVGISKIEELEKQIARLEATVSHLVHKQTDVAKRYWLDDYKEEDMF